MGINALIRYFDLASNARLQAPQAYAAGEAPKLHWFPQYLALLVGIISQRFFTAYIQSGHWNLTGFWSWFVASIIVAILAFPAVYKRTFEADKPLFVQLCVIFAAGMGWESLVRVGEKAATGV